MEVIYVVNGKVRRKTKMELKLKKATENNEGYISGILDNEEGYRISWGLKIEKFEN